MFYSIRIARWMFSRIVASSTRVYVVTRNPNHSSFSHSAIHTYLVDVVDVVVQVCMHPFLGRLGNIYFFHPRRRSSVVSVAATHAVDSNEPRRCVVESRLFPRVDHTSDRRRSFSPVRLTRRGRFTTRKSRGYFSVSHSSVRCPRSSIDAIGAFGGRRNVSSATDRTVGFFCVCCLMSSKKPKKEYRSMERRFRFDGLLMIKVIKITSSFRLFVLWFRYGLRRLGGGRVSLARSIASSIYRSSSVSELSRNSSSSTGAVMADSESDCTMSLTTLSFFASISSMVMGWASRRSSP